MSKKRKTDENQIQIDRPKAHLGEAEEGAPDVVQLAVSTVAADSSQLGAALCLSVLPVSCSTSSSPSSSSSNASLSRTIRETHSMSEDLSDFFIQWDDLINHIESQAIQVENIAATQSYDFLIDFLTVNKVCDLSFTKSPDGWMCETQILMRLMTSAIQSRCSSTTNLSDVQRRRCSNSLTFQRRHRKYILALLFIKCVVDVDVTDDDFWNIFQSNVNKANNFSKNVDALAGVPLLTKKLVTDFLFVTKTKNDPRESKTTTTTSHAFFVLKDTTPTSSSASPDSSETCCGADSSDRVAAADAGYNGVGSGSVEGNDAQSPCPATATTNNGVVAPVQSQPDASMTTTHENTWPFLYTILLSQSTVKGGSGRAGRTLDTFYRASTYLSNCLHNHNEPRMLVFYLKNLGDIKVVKVEAVWFMLIDMISMEKHGHAARTCTTSGSNVLVSRLQQGNEARRNTIISSAVINENHWKVEPEPSSSTSSQSIRSLNKDIKGCTYCNFGLMERHCITCFAR
jgi:hypothetical protein